MSDNKTPAPDMQNIIEQAVQAALSDEKTIQNMISEKVKTYMAEIINDMFRWGDVKDAIKNKLKAIMLPAIEAYDFSDYVTNLEKVLTEIISGSAVSVNNTVLHNFGIIMCPPNNPSSVTLDDLFDAYKKFVADIVDTDGRNVIFDGGTPVYENVGCEIHVENIKSSYTNSDTERYVVSFTADEVSEYNESMNAEIELRRYNFMPEGEYSIQIYLNGKTLRDISSFEAYLYSLMVNHIPLKTNIDLDGFSDDDEVTPTNEPEPVYK